MHSTKLRREHLHGLLLGVAIGDALGCCREGLDRRVALRMFGRPPLRYALLPGKGIYGDDTRMLLLAAQALLNSRSDLRTYRWVFQSRLSWYLLSLPCGAGCSTITAAAKSWLMRLGVSSGVRSAGNGAATRAIFSALVMNGTGHRLSKWVEETTKLTHTHPLAIDGCQVLAVLAECGSMTKSGGLIAEDVLSKAIDASTQSDIKDKLLALRPFLQRDRSPRAAARHFGWDQGISDCMVPTTIMATYCWLRYPTDFRRAVESAIVLGGNCTSLAAIVGGLVGGHVGVNELPAELIRRLGGFPHGPDWIEIMAERLSDWPHGSDDLHGARAQPSDPPFQLLRNALTISIVLLHMVLRIPYRLCTSTTPKRLAPARH